MRGIYPSLLPWSAIPCFPILFVLSFYILASLKAQNGYHMEQLSHVKIKEAASSIWGYVHPDGREYALLGTMEGVRIYDLSDPANPVERAFIPGTSSPWRELKTAGDFAYVSTEAGDGLLIIDLRKAPSEFPYRFVHRFYNAAGDSFLIHSAHTLYVDEKNYIYLAGSRPTGPGFVILDPGPDPFQPLLLSYSDEAYHHEVHAFRDLLYGAELYHGVFSIWDISDRQNPRRLSDQPTAKSFTHSVWVEREREILYTADEVEGAVVEAWDVRDPDAIKRTDSYKVLQGASPYTIPHNVFHYRDKLYVSYYTEGLRVLDTKDPENLIEVAYFDTHDQNDRGFHGCWSVYPYYPSGICVASDIENGLFVLQYDGNEPAYLHARISDANDGSPIANARLEIEQNGRIVTEFSNLQGRLKSGFPEADTVLVRVFKKGYHPYSRSVVLDKTNPLEMEIPLVELQKHDIRFVVREQGSGKPLSAARLRFSNADFNYNFTMDDQGEWIASSMYEGVWKVFAGRWGHRQPSGLDFTVSSDTSLIIELVPGYEDAFVLDLGWIVQSQDPKVSWKIGDFSEYDTRFTNFPSEDVSGDYGQSCYYTDNYYDSDPVFRLRGELNLISPPMDLSAFRSIALSYYAWAYGGYTASKKIWLQLADTSLLLENVPENLSGNFNPKSAFSLDVLTFKRDSARFIFQLFNDSATADMAIRLLAALDAFQLTGTPLTKTDHEAGKDSRVLRLTPNPARHSISVQGSPIPPDARYEILDLLGSTVKKGFLDLRPSLFVEDLPPGCYYVRFNFDSNLYKFIRI